LAKELSKRHKVHVFSRGWGEEYSEYAEVFDGIPVKRMNTPPPRKRFPDTYIDDRVALSFSDFLQDLEPDIIHVQHCIGLGMSLLEVSIERSIPILLFLHDFYLMCHRVFLLKPDGQLCYGPKGQRYCADCILAFDHSLSEVKARELGLMRYHYVQGLLSKIDHILAPSQFVKERFRANFRTIRKITVSPLGLDLRLAEDFEKKESRRLRFGYIGQSYPYKGVHLLVEAFKGLRGKDAELRIHGGGEPDYLNALRKDASNTDILFFGPYGHDELGRILSEIDVFVMPSICHESFSFTIREALSVGIPAVVSDVRAQADAIIEGFNGLHFQCGDPDDLRRKLQRIIEEPGLLTKLSNNAKKTPIPGIDEQTERLEILYRKLAQRSRKRGPRRAERMFPSGRPLFNVLTYVRSLEEGKRNLETEMTGELNRMRGELSERESKIQALESERANLTNELDRVRGKLSERESKIGALQGKIGALQSELIGINQQLDAIRHSFGYRLMKAYASRIDRLLPDGTRRGELRKLMVTSLGVAAEEGLHSLLSQAWRKIRRREFRSAEPVTAKPATVSQLLPQPRTLSEQVLKEKLSLFLSQPSAKLVFPRFEEPIVSIVIPTFNKAEYLYQCLESILAYGDVPLELIVVDDSSRDETPRLLEKLENVQVVRNRVNLEFIRSSNKGAGLTKGRHILFLNNDVTLTAQALSTLVATIEQYPRCGAVGAKLVRPDGTLQEAGSIIWQDGSASGYGRDSNPQEPEYCYLREVDYCSAACLLVRAELFQKLGGFDELYLPAYYEDSDLCLGIQQLGFKIVFQPQVTILHHEFGSRSFERAEVLCQANRPKFAKKWAAILQEQHPYGEVLQARDRHQGKRVLIIDDQVPEPRLGIGLPRARQMLEFLSELGYVVTFVPLTNRTPWQPTTSELQQLGIEVFYGESFRPAELLRNRSGHYDIVIISRPHNARELLSLTRQYYPNALIIYDAEALFSMREILKAQVEGRSLSETEKRKMLSEELDLMKEADVVVTVSEAERETILKEAGQLDMKVWGHTHDLHVPATPFSERRDILFVGSFTHGHPPNTDAVLHFVTGIFPKIREKLPECRFIVVGSSPPEPVRRLASPHVIVTGFVEELREYYEKCRLLVVPLRFGAGLNYKLTEAMSYGIPSVISPVAAQGLAAQDEKQVLVARDDEEFAEKTIRLYTDEVLWHEIQQGAQRYIRDNCSPQMMKKKLAEILSQQAKGSSGQSS
jgi:glycosyltransferase involved in cell wall biosynthesis